MKYGLMKLKVEKTVLYLHTLASLEEKKKTMKVVFLNRSAIATLSSESK